MPPETHKATMSTLGRRPETDYDLPEPPWWRKESPLYRAFGVLFILLFASFVCWAIEEVLTQPAITPVNETAAAKYRSNLCALRLARLSNAVGPRLWDEEQAERFLEACNLEE